MNTPFPQEDWYVGVAGEALEIFSDLDDLPTEGRGRPTGKPLDLSPIFSRFLRFKTCFEPEWFAMFDEGDFLPIDANRDGLDWAESFIDALADRWGWRPAILMADHGLRGLQLLDVLDATRPTLTRVDRRAIKAIRPRLVDLVVEASSSLEASTRNSTPMPTTYPCSA